MPEYDDLTLFANPSLRYPKAVPNTHTIGQESPEIQLGALRITIDYNEVERGTFYTFISTYVSCLRHDGHRVKFTDLPDSLIHQAILGVVEYSEREFYRHINGSYNSYLVEGDTVYWMGGHPSYHKADIGMLVDHYVKGKEGVNPDDLPSNMMKVERMISNDLIYGIFMRQSFLTFDKHSVYAADDCDD